MVWIYTTELPKRVVTKRSLGMRQRTVNYGFAHLGENDPSGYRFRHKAVTLQPGQWGYDAIVSAIITAEYPRDRMDAIVNNYLADPTNDTAIEEMQEMQAFRKAAKAIALEAIEVEKTQREKT